MDIKIKTIASEDEKSGRAKLFDLYKSNPIPDSEVLSNISLFQKRQDFTKQLFFNEIYGEIVKVHGSVFEFGVRWGQNLVTLNNLRGIYEPYNYSRKIIGFDTFEGFLDIDEKDGAHEAVKKGAFAVSKGYEEYLSKILEYHESEAPLSHIKKNSLLKGDASVMLKNYLEEHPETIIAFAYFDFDLYEPTKKCLELIKPYLTKGSVIGFDELNDPGFPGETLAVRETLGLSNIRLRRNRFSGIQSYFIVE